MTRRTTRTGSGGAAPAFLVVLTGVALAAGAGWALAGTSGPGDEGAPAEMTCHGHGQRGPGPRMGEAGPWGGPGRGPGPGHGHGFGPGRGPGGGFGPGPGDEAPLRILDSMPGDLALTDEQWASVLEIMGETGEALEPLEASQADRHRALRELMHATPVNEEAIRASVLDMAEVQADMAVLHARTRARVVALLSPEQKQYLEESRAELQQRRQRHQQLRRRMRGGDEPGAGAS